MLEFSHTGIDEIASRVGYNDVEAFRLWVPKSYRAYALRVPPALLTDLLGSRLEQLLRPADRNSHSGSAQALTDYLELALVRPGVSRPIPSLSAIRTIRRTVFRSAPVDRAMPRIFSPANQRRMI
jgi:hypothetical protein